MRCMSTMRQVVRMIPVLFVGQLVGCAASGPSASTFSMRHFADTKASEALLASEAVLQDHGYDLDRRDLTSGILVTVPMEADTRERYGNQARRLGTEGRRRRVVTMHASELPEGVNVYCRVTIQEQSTQVYRFLAESNRGEGSETTTAIDRDAATTARQNTVWHNVDRDRPAERAILDSIVIGGSAAEPPEVNSPPETSTNE